MEWACVTWRQSPGWLCAGRIEQGAHGDCRFVAIHCRHADDLALAWVPTLPVAILLSASLYDVFSQLF